MTKRLWLKWISRGVIKLLLVGWLLSWSAADLTDIGYLFPTEMAVAALILLVVWETESPWDSDMERGSDD